MRPVYLAFMLLVMTVAAACVPIQPEEPSGEVVTLYVGPELVDCVGVGPMQCTQVRLSPEDEYQLFYDTIDGFEFEEGNAYELEVLIQKRENAPADASANTYTLQRILNKQPVALQSTTETWIIGPEFVDCEGGAGPQLCMRIRKSPDGEWQLFYGAIDGFEYEEGYQYEIVVQIDPVENPPADGSSLQYTLVELVDKEAVTP